MMGFMDHRMAHALRSSHSITTTTGTSHGSFPANDLFSWTDPRVLAWIYSSLIIIFYVAIMSIILCSNLHRFGERRGHASLNQRPVTSIVSESDGSDYESASELNVLDCTGGRYSSIEMSASGQEKNFIHWKNAQSTSRTDQVYLV